MNTLRMKMKVRAEENAPRAPYKSHAPPMHQTELVSLIKVGDGKDKIREERGATYHELE